MKNLFLALAFTCASTYAFAQYNYVETGANGNTIVQGQYSADPGITPNDSKQTVATKLAAVHKVGNWKYWTEAGTLIAEEHYTLSGIRIGIWKTWTNGGILSSEINFTASTAVFYYENGTKAEEGSINADMVRTGAWKGWHSNGTVNYTGSYNAQGNKTGVWKYFDAQGNSIGTENY